MTSKSYDHEDFGRLVGEEESMSLEQMREPAEPDAYEQSILSKRMSRKRKAPADEEVHYITYFSFCSLFIYYFQIFFFNIYNLIFINNKII